MLIVTEELSGRPKISVKDWADNEPQKRNVMNSKAGIELNRMVDRLG